MFLPMGNPGIFDVDYDSIVVKPSNGSLKFEYAFPG